MENRMEFLTAEQQKFYELVSQYPKISALWDWKGRTFRIDAYNQALKVMSKHEITLANFFAGLWSDNNKGVDIFAVAQLGVKERKMIVTWLAAPFWP